MAPVVPLIGAVAGAAVSASTIGATLSLGLGLGFSAAGLLGSAAGLVVSTAVNQLGSRALSKKPKQPSFTAEAQGRAISFRGTVESHKLVYGRAKVSGPITFIHTTSDGAGGAGGPLVNKFYHGIIVLAAHEVEEIGQIYLNDQAVSLDGGGFVTTAPYYQTSTSQVEATANVVGSVLAANVVTVTTAAPHGFSVGDAGRLETRTPIGGAFTITAVPSPTTFRFARTATNQSTSGGVAYVPRTVTTGSSYVRIEKFLGSASQAASSLLLADCPDIWTGEHRGRGVAYLYFRFEKNDDVFPFGPPNVSAVVKGRKIYDPRSGLTVWSDNAALCLRDYLTARDGSAIDQPYGFGIATSRIDDAYVTAAANVCDESVTKADGSTQARYTCNGVVDTATGRLDNLTQLLTACAGTVTEVQDQFRIHAAAYDSPSGTITLDQVCGEMDINCRTPRQELFNAVRGVFVDPAKGYQPTDFPPVSNATYQADDNGERLTRDLELPFTNDVEAAQRIAKLILEKARQDIHVQMPLMHHAIRYSVFDVVNVTDADAGWSGKPFRILGWSMPEAGGPIVLRLQGESSASYAWSAGEATTVDAAPDTNLPDPFTVQPPGNPAVVERKYVTTDGSGVKTKAVVTWSASTDAFAREYQLEYKLSTATAYIVAGRTSATTFDVLDTAPGAYDFRVKAFNNVGVSSAFANNTALLSGLTDAPSDIAGFSLNAITGNAHLSWDAVPSDETNLDVRVGGSIRVRFSPLITGVSWSSATDIGPALSGIATQAVLPLLVGTYLIKAVDSVGNESVNATVISSTVAAVGRTNLLVTSTQHSTFGGAKTNLVVLGSDLFDSAENFDSGDLIDDGSSDVVMRLDSADLFDSAEDFDSDEFFDAGSEGFATSGTYLFDTHVDVGKVTISRVTALLDVSIYDGIGQFDSEDEFDGPGAFDGDDETAVSVKLYVSTTDDDPAGTPTWTDWRQFFVGEYTCRAYRFKLEIVSSNGAYNADIRRLSVTVDMPDIVESGSLTTSASGLTAIAFSRTFVITPAIGSTMKNAATGDYVVLSSASATGFSLGVKDAGGSFVARSTDWVAHGY